MQQHNVYQHPSLPATAVKVGWGWPAFFFSGVWCLIKGLYVQFVIVIAIMFGGIIMGAFVFQDADAVDGIRTLLMIGVSIYFGMNGNEIRHKDLLGKGYKVVKTVSANSPEDALAKAGPLGAPTVAAGGADENKYQNLEKLKALLDEGAISEEEFQAEKRKLLK